MQNAMKRISRYIISEGSHYSTHDIRVKPIRLVRSAEKLVKDCVLYS
jgi:hypothetical protein